jgi:hypothetical protein
MSDKSKKINVFTNPTLYAIQMIIEIASCDDKVVRLDLAKEAIESLDIARDEVQCQKYE